MARRQMSAPIDSWKQPQRVTKRIPHQPTRSSARLRGRRESSILAGINIEERNHLPSPESDSYTRKKKQATVPDQSAQDQFTSVSRHRDSEAPAISTTIKRYSRRGDTPSQKRKRSHESEAEDAESQSLARCPQKRQRASLVRSAAEYTTRQEPNTISDNKFDPVEYWRQENEWPRTYFKPDSQAERELKRYFCLEEYIVDQEINMAHVLARKKSSSSLGRRNSDSGIVTPSDQKPREDKYATYRSATYETVLATKGSFMKEWKAGITKESKAAYQSLLDTEQKVLEESFFRDDQFKATCEKIRNRNENRIIRDVSLLIVPSPEILDTQGATHLDHLIESINEGWNSSIPLYGTRPQPDFSVGFRRSAFTDQQVAKLTPFVGEITDFYTSYFMATWQIYFPFLACEVKCGAAALDVADRQNAHSMTLAVRGVVELFKYVKREKELHRTILAFSISHDHSNVRIYGHYPVIADDNVTFYRHPIQEFSFTALDGREKWTTYKFTKNVYDIWMPAHLKMICSAIDELPADINFGVSAVNSFASAASTEMESDQADSQETATSAPSSQGTVGFKKPRLATTKAMLQEEKNKLQQEKDDLRDQVNALIRQQQEQQRQQQEQQRQQQEKMDQKFERLERQREQEREEMKLQTEKQLEQQRKQMEQLISILKAKG